ncbi:MAG: PAS domain-containing sensor histidine kinase [Candidatus Eremiobacteraeota bacterium]|nr:PAS domain-containing sensor histidine kinase [Candidatus Eremiobacteraeota bacterium]
MSVRFSQFLAAVVLALVALALFRTASAYQDTAIAADVRERGTAIVERETRRLGDRIATIESLAEQVADQGRFSPQAFAQAARAEMGKDPALKAVDFFNADDVHIAHVASSSPANSDVPKYSIRSMSPDDLRAVQIALFDASLSRATSVSAVPPKATAAAGSEDSRGHFYLVTKVYSRNRELGSVVQNLDARQLVLADIASKAPASFALDDGRGRPLHTVSPAQNDVDTWTFPIAFADRVLQLTLAAPPHLETNRWWFVLGWFALVLAIVLPMEVVSTINRRVQSLNEELETRVAARTKQLEASLEESRRLAVVVESVHEGVMAIDASGFVRYVNAALCRELQCLPHALVNQPIAELSVLGISEQQLADIRAGVSETGFIYREMERTRSDGSRYVAGVTFTRHALEGSDTIIAVSRDVTERRRLVDQLLEAKSRLEGDTRTRADFIATASHELRTPVTTLRTLAALLTEKLGPRELLPSEDNRLLEILDHETKRLARLVDDLLKIAKIDAPEVVLVDHLVDLRAIVKAEIEEFQRFGDAGPTVELHLSDSPVMVRGDEEALRSVIHNLVGNARKFTAPTGHVDVSIEQDADHARLIVSDTGVGIAKADLPHIFERFYRAPLTASRASGAGLGLAIVARFVELMHGSVSVASQLGRGTTISIEYPLAAKTDSIAGTQALGQR